MSRLKRFKEFDENVKQRFRAGARLRYKRIKSDPAAGELMIIEFVMACLIAVSLYVYFDKNVNIFPPGINIPFPLNALGVVFLVIIAALVFQNYKYIRLKLLLKKIETAKPKITGKKRNR